MTEKLTKNGRQKGRPSKWKHAGYSILARRGDVPADHPKRKYLRTYLEGIRRGLVRDLGPAEADLTTAQLALVNHVISKIAITRLIEERLAEVGIFDAAGELDPALGKFFLAASNSLRLDLMALGIDKRRGVEIIDLGRYIAESERSGPGSGGDGANPESAGTASGGDKGEETPEGQAEGSEGGAIARPGASVREIFGEGHDSNSG
jgi:hypothetical protein